MLGEGGSLRPVPNVLLLPPVPNFNEFDPASSTTIARQWFQTSNLIQSRQIQKPQNMRNMNRITQNILNNL